MISLRSCIKRNILRTVFIAFAILATPAVNASYKGKVFIDQNQDRNLNSGEPGLGNVAVTDGLNVVLTNERGEFELAGNPKTRFIYITVPAGYKASVMHYMPVKDSIDAYNFGLIPFATSAKDTTRFIQITDTETTEDNGWISPIRDYARNEKVSFIIHTGDICCDNGLYFHAEKVNSETMGVPMFYCIGNHDLLKGDYGEQVFEAVFGPVYYSFDAGNTHYIVTPMLGGDHKPSYTKEDVYRWMKNDLKYVDSKKNLVVFNHDLLTFREEFIYRISKNEQINLNQHNLKAWIYGHWHINYMKKHTKSGVISVCASPPDKGGIDHSSSNFVVYEMISNGVGSIRPRYNYLDNHLTIVSPIGNSASEGQNNQLNVSVNFYSTTSQTREVLCRIENGNTLTRWQALDQMTDWNWAGKLQFDETNCGKEMTIRVRAYTKSGDSVTLIKKFIVPVSGKAGNIKAESLIPLKLSWIRNAGGNIWMTSPVYSNGKVFIATTDEFGHRNTYILSYNSNTGELLWKYTTKSSIKNTICVEGGKVLATDEEGITYAIDAETGKLAWEKDLSRDYLPAYVSGNVAAGGILYAGFGNYLSALSITDGTELWKNKDWSGGEGTTTTHSIAGEVLIASSNWHALYGHDIQTGEKKWVVNSDGIRFRSATSVYTDDTLFVIAESAIVKMNPQDGSIYKSYPVKYNLQVASTPLVTGNMIIIGTAANGLVAFDRYTMNELWNVKTGPSLIYTSPYSKPPSATVESGPVQVKDYICFGASDGFLYLVDGKDGREAQRIELGAPVLGKVCYANNAVFVADFSGNIIRFELR